LTQPTAAATVGPMQALIAALIVVVVVAAVGAFYLFEPSSRQVWLWVLIILIAILAIAELWWLMS
jgi:hypothetical protein